MHERLAAALRDAIRQGHLRPGAVLPPSRMLAADTGCSRWVVTEAYSRLVGEGFLRARTGSGTRVHEDAGMPEIPEPAAAGYRYDLFPGVPDLRAFPRWRWSDALRTAATAMSHGDLWYAAENGLPQLRVALAEYLARCRRAAVSASDVIVTSGITNGLAQVFAALRRAGFTAVAVEDPSWQRPWLVARECGLVVVPIPVDSGGIQVKRIIGRAELRAVLLTPSHQFPMGTVLAEDRRVELLSWLRQVDGVLLEDDYDAEFRYDRTPVGAMQGVDPDRVILFGSVSKTMAPAVGVGWMVAPTRWRTAVRAANPGAAAPSPLIQGAFAGFLVDGGFDRHLRDSNRRLRRRREAVLCALQSRLPRLRVSGGAAGLHLVLHLGEQHRGRVKYLVDQLHRNGLRLCDLDDFRHRPDSEDPGLVLGYGNLADTVVDEAIEQLAEVLSL